jgi:hypothetical protein
LVEILGPVILWIGTVFLMMLHPRFQSMQFKNYNYTE